MKYDKYIVLSQILSVIIMSLIVISSVKVSIEIPGINECVIQFFEAISLMYVIIFSIIGREHGSKFLSFIAVLLIITSVVIAATYYMFTFATTVVILSIVIIAMSLIS